MREKGVEGMLFEVIVAYFGGRYQRVNVGHSFSDYVETRHGGPQGSVIMLFAPLEVGKHGLRPERGFRPEGLYRYYHSKKKKRVTLMRPKTFIFETRETFL